MKKLSHPVFNNAIQNGFTLVELIVTISILAILGTIGFLSLQWYSSSARDSSRVSDITAIMKSLEFNQVVSGMYPAPDSSFLVTYSGWTVWTQWVFGAGAHAKLVNANINKSPVDPLSNQSYVYSVLGFWNAYQIQASYEGDVLSASSSLIDTAYAESGNPNIALIKWTYGWLVAKTQTGGMIYVLATPSIITNIGTAGGSYEISTNSLSGTLLMHANSNKIGVPYNPNRVVFSGSVLPKDDSSLGITDFMNALQSAYTWATITRTSEISGLLATSSPGLVSLGTSILQNHLGSKPGTSSSVSLPATYSSGATYTVGQSFSLSGAIVTVTAAGIGVSSTKADPTCDTNDIAIWQWGTNNVQIWAACNVGATTTVGYDTVPVQSVHSDPALPTNRVSAVQGNFYQWGRNDNVTSGTWTTSQWGGAFTSPANTTGNTNFYQWEGTYGDWKWAGATNPAGGWNTGNGWDNQGPCPAGYHIPTGGTSDNTTQWGMLYSIINSASTFGSCSQANVYDRTVCAMKFPYAGFRSWSNGNYFAQGEYGYYWSSSLSSARAYYAYFTSGASSTTVTNPRAVGFSLRCIKN